MKFLDIFKAHLNEVVDLLGTKTSDFDPKMIKKGSKIEKEHTDDQKKAEKIAKQHTAEFPKKKDSKIGSDYYKELDKMEGKLKRGVKQSFKDMVAEMDAKDLKENTMAGGAGSMFGPNVVTTATPFSGDNYAPGDARMPKILGFGSKGKGKKKKQKTPMIRRTLVRESKEYNKFLTSTPESYGSQYFTLDIPVGVNPPKVGERLILDNKNVVVFAVSSPDDIAKGRGGPVARSMEKYGIGYKVKCLPEGHEYLKRLNEALVSKTPFLIRKDGISLRDGSSDRDYRGYAVSWAFNPLQAIAIYRKKMLAQGKSNWGNFDAVELTPEIKDKIDSRFSHRTNPAPSVGGPKPVIDGTPAGTGGQLTLGI